LELFERIEKQVEGELKLVPFITVGADRRDVAPNFASMAIATMLDSVHAIAGICPLVWMRIASAAEHPASIAALAR
jgi:hypothetical protein